MRPLFSVREDGPTFSNKSSVLFISFAQWFTDGFLLTDPKDRCRTYTSHQIDLSPVYGLGPAETEALRVGSSMAGKRGLLKTHDRDGEEYAPFLFDEKKIGQFLKNDEGFDGLPRLFFDPEDFETRAVKDKFRSLRPPESFKKLRQHIARERAAELAKKTFAFGGEQANVTPFTAALNTLFIREHNRLAGLLETKYPDWDDERIFQTSRNINIVLLIKIVVEEYINHIAPYYFKLRADPSVSWRAAWNRPNWIPIEFNLLYRWHSMVPDEFAIGEKVVGSNVIGEKCVKLRDIIHNNSLLLERGVAGMLVTASRQRSWRLDLLNTPADLIDVELASIQQGRDNHIGSYNDYRQAFGYPRVTKFEQITSDPEKIQRLSQLYRDVDSIEFFVGLFAEDVAPRSALPPLIGRMVALDAFSHALTNPLLSEEVFNEKTFSKEGMETIRTTHTLQDILNRNLAPVHQPVKINMAYTL